MVHNATLAWSAPVGQLILLDESRCEAYMSDHAPDDPHAVAFSQELIAAPFADGWDVGALHEALVVLSLAEVRSFAL